MIRESNEDVRELIRIKIQFLSTSPPHPYLYYSRRYSTSDEFDAVLFHIRTDLVRYLLIKPSEQD